MVFSGSWWLLGCWKFCIQVFGVGIEVSRKDLGMKTFKSHSKKFRRLVWWVDHLVNLPLVLYDLPVIYYALDAQVRFSGFLLCRIGRLLTVGLLFLPRLFLGWRLCHSLKLSCSCQTLNVRMKSNNLKVWLTFWFLRLVTTVTNSRTAGRNRGLDAWDVVDNGSSYSVESLGLWIQWISSSLRRYLKTNPFLSSYSQCTVFWTIVVILCK